MDIADQSSNFSIDGGSEAEWCQTGGTGLSWEPVPMQKLRSPSHWKSGTLISHTFSGDVCLSSRDHWLSVWWNGNGCLSGDLLGPS